MQSNDLKKVKNKKKEQKKVATNRREKLANQHPLEGYTRYICVFKSRNIYESVIT